MATICQTAIGEGAAVAPGQASALRGRAVDLRLGSQLAWTTTAPVGCLLPSALDAERVSVPDSLLLAGQGRLRDRHPADVQAIRLSTWFSGVGTAKFCAQILSKSGPNGNRR